VTLYVERILFAVPVSKMGRLTLGKFWIHNFIFAFCNRCMSSVSMICPPFVYSLNPNILEQWMNAHVAMVRLP
jgi:hypothetical protein